MPGQIVDATYTHAAAVHALVEAALSVPVYLDEVTNTASPYVVMWSGAGEHRSLTVGSYSQFFRDVIGITGVGTTKQEASAQRDRACVALLDVRPVVAGRKCAPLRQIPLQTPVMQPPGEVDPVTGRPVFTAYAQFEIYSTPADTT